MIRPIIDKLNDEILRILNKIIIQINFINKDESSHSDKKGVYIDEFFQFNFLNQHLDFFLDVIFEKGYNVWFKSYSGALRRYLWKSFYQVFIYALISLSRIKQELIKAARKVNLNKKNKEIQNFKTKLFSYLGNSMCSSISLKTNLNRENIPKSLGFLDILYNKKLDDLKLKLTRRLMTNNLKIKYYNELRKLKLKYKYEYTLSELVNHCIHSDHFESYFKYNSSREVKQEYFQTAEKLILDFIKKYDIKLKKYLDSLNCTHYFLTHKIYERIKSVCLQICVQEIQIKSLDHYKEFKNFYSKCPICGKDNINQINCEKIYFTKKFLYFKEVLIETMHEVGSLNDLNDEDCFFGIPCENCFYFARNIQGNRKSLDNLEYFLDKYKLCPICSNKNHTDYLISFYHDKSRSDLRDSLIKHMNSTEGIEKGFQFQLGIPCCNCYEKIFGEKPEFLSNFY